MQGTVYWIHGIDGHELGISSDRHLYLYGQDKYRWLDRTQSVSWSAWAYLGRPTSYQDRRHCKYIVIGSAAIGCGLWMSVCRTYLNRQLRRKYIVNKSYLNRIYSASSVTAAQSECRNGTISPIIADCCHSSVSPLIGRGRHDREQIVAQWNGGINQDHQLYLELVLLTCHYGRLMSLMPWTSKVSGNLLLSSKI